MLFKCLLQAIRQACHVRNSDSGRSVAGVLFRAGGSLSVCRGFGCLMERPVWITTPVECPLDVVLLLSDLLRVSGDGIRPVVQGSNHSQFVY